MPTSSDPRPSGENVMIGRFIVSLLLVFFQALDGMPLNALRQCAECEKWFFHISEKIKLYCSNRCAARKATRDSRARIREGQPE